VHIVTFFLIFVASAPSFFWFKKWNIGHETIFIIQN
jgi:hypothetical protein